MINSRAIGDLTPDAQIWFERWRSHVEREAGLRYPWDYIITSTYRDQECQDWLYEQGRTRPGKIVTWTHHSRHTGRRAWDVAIVKDGEPQWNVVKADVDEDGLPDYKELAEVGRMMGLNCGYWWKKQDAPHFETAEVVG